MIKKAYTVKDRTTEAYGPPFFMNSDGEAIRGFTDAINSKDENSNLWKHPEDFDLFAIGEYNDQEGKFTNEPKPKSLVLGKQVAIRN